MVSHTYDDGPNNYTIEVDLVDEDGTYLAVDSLAVTVNNVPPMVDLTGPGSVDEGDPNTWLLGSIVDPGADTVSQYVIHWGDGQSDTFTAAQIAAMSRMVSHTYDDGPNNYTIEVDLVDEDGTYLAVDSLAVTVNNVPPMLMLSGAAQVDEGSQYTLNLSSFDPGADTITQWTIDWGDGVQVVMGSPTSVMHTYADGETNYTITATATDEDGTFAAGNSVSVLVRNVAPTLTLAGNSSVDEGSLYTLNLTSFDPGADTITHWTINWGDSIELVTGNPLSVTHTYADGSQNFTITATATDEDGTFAAGNSVTVTIDNVPPELAAIGERTVQEGTELSIIDLGLIMDQGFRDLALGTEENFRFWIDWGDRDLLLDPSAPVTGTAMIDHIGGPMDPTLASFNGAHTYADNGTYLVTVRVADDDMGAFSTPDLFANGVAGTHFVERTFLVHVGNADPAVTTPHGDLTVSEGQTFSFSDLATFTDPGFDNPLHPAGPQSESFTYDIDWGDGRNPITGMSIADMNGMAGTASRGVIAGTHVYADDGVYQVTVTVHDDDGGVGAHQFFVTVENVAPSLTGNLGTLHVNEGTPFVLSNLGGGVFNLGLGITDPGFDNPAAGTQETFTGMTVDWGDGTTSDALMVTGRVSDLVDGPTTALLQHTPHVYADNGDYVVTITLTDDDGGQLVPQQIVIHVDNVAPTLTLTTDSFTVNEGSVMNIPNLGTFSDPGFSDAGNMPPSVETFTYWIDWGDGTIETGQMPASVTNGMRPDMLTPELTIPTLGSLADSHLYADNPTGGNQYTITVRLADDDMTGNFSTGMDGIDYVEKQFVVTVLNVDPTLQPISATDVEPTGRTVLMLTFSDPGADSFQVLVDWGERLDLPPDQRFVVETVHTGAVPPGTPLSFTLEHFYTGPPDPLHPTADIIITVKIHDDDALFAGVVEAGISNLESVAISNPGIETTRVAINTTPQVPRLEFTPPAPAEVFVDQTTSSVQSLESTEVRVASGESAITSDRYLVLVVVSPDGQEIESHRVKDEALQDLRGLFATLPENRYRIYLVRTENNSWRLVIEVSVRRYYDRALRQWRGRIVDPADISEGTRDRPPTSETSLPERAVPLEENPLLEPLSQSSEPAGAPQTTDGGKIPNPDGQADIQTPRPNPRPLRWSLPLAALAMTAAGSNWSQRLEAALRTAGERDWQRLRRAGRQRRRLDRFAPQAGARNDIWASTINGD
jgi:hypothetical protein